MEEIHRFGLLLSKTLLGLVIKAAFSLGEERIAKKICMHIPAMEEDQRGVFLSPLLFISAQT
jgi:hypothetical protein